MRLAKRRSFALSRHPPPRIGRTDERRDQMECTLARFITTLRPSYSAETLLPPPQRGRREGEVEARRPVAKRQGVV